MKIILILLSFFQSTEKKDDFQFPDLELDENDSTGDKALYFRTEPSSSALDKIDMNSFIFEIYKDQLINNQFLQESFSALENSEVVFLSHTAPTLADSYKFHRLLAQNSAILELLRIIYFESISDHPLKQARANKILSNIEKLAAQNRLNGKILSTAYKDKGISVEFIDDEKSKKAVTLDIINSLNLNNENANYLNELIDHLSIYNDHAGTFVKPNRLYQFFTKQKNKSITQWNKTISKYQSSGSVAISELISLRISEDTNFDEVSLRKIVLLENKQRELLINGLSSIAALYRTLSAY
ncbi:MAG: hypothetical protein HY606_02375, partial [Planctomycetes bacterium]|nr:hypothetical protein [Planctomycetota bacterium]